MEFLKQCGCFVTDVVYPENLVLIQNTSKANVRATKTTGSIAISLIAHFQEEFMLIHFKFLPLFENIHIDFAHKFLFPNIARTLAER